MNKMLKKILIISTGGTFNKVYHPQKGTLEVDPQSNPLKDLASKWCFEFEVLNIIGKDSLEITSQDRLELLSVIHQSNYNHIIVIHGTDTMDTTAEYLADSEVEKTVVLTGAMVPYSIDPVEATANFASAYGYLTSSDKEGVFVAMNGVIDSFDKVKKDRTKGYFIHT